MAVISAGTPAPEFSLTSSGGVQRSLADYRGRRLVLVFYPGDWTPVCGDQLTLYNELLPEFSRYGAEVIGISVDSAWCHTAYAADRRLKIALLADFEPKGKVARSYGVYNSVEGTAERALFVIDEHGLVRWAFVSDYGVNPGADGILLALEGLPESAS